METRALTRHIRWLLRRLAHMKLLPMEVQNVGWCCSAEERPDDDHDRKVGKRRRLTKLARIAVGGLWVPAAAWHIFTPRSTPYWVRCSAIPAELIDKDLAVPHFLEFLPLIFFANPFCLIVCLGFNQSILSSWWFWRDTRARSSLVARFFCI